MLPRSPLEGPIGIPRLRTGWALLWPDPKLSSNSAPGMSGTNSLGATTALSQADLRPPGTFLGVRRLNF